MNKAKSNFVVRRHVVILALGGRCSCTGEDCWHEGPCQVTDIRCLQLDHINGGGNKEIKLLGGTPAMVDKYYNNPDLAKRRVQVLCANCNWTKRCRRDEKNHGAGIPAKVGLLADELAVLKEQGADAVASEAEGY